MKRLKCQCCGNEDNFYTKNSYKGTYNFHFNGSGEETDNSEMFSNADSRYTSKFIYCANCHCRVGKIEDFEAWNKRSEEDD